MEKGTKEILKNIAIIVLVPTVVAGAYYGFKFAHKKYKQKKEKDKEKEGNDAVGSGKKTALKVNQDGSVDTTGMSKYIINVPFSLQKELFMNGEFYDSIKKVNYSHIKDWVENDDKKNPSMIKVQIMSLPSDLAELNDIVKKLNDKITIVAAS